LKKKYLYGWGISNVLRHFLFTVRVANSLLKHWIRSRTFFFKPRVRAWPTVVEAPDLEVEKISGVPGAQCA
jgi:hypothetical protein